MQKKTDVRKIVYTALLAAIYTVLCVALAPISYGSVQVRVSEALVMLPVLGPWSIAGVTLGCFLSNLVGVFTGANVLGALDCVFGTLATLLAALCSYALRRVRIKGLPLASALPPILLNGVIIGAELCVMLTGGWNWAVFAIQGAWVALGEAAAVLVLGVPLAVLAEKNPTLQKAFALRKSIEK